MSIAKDQLRVAAIIAVLIAVFIGAGYVPQRWATQRYRDQIAEAKLQLGVDLAGSKELAILAAEVDELQRQAGSTSKEVPAESELAELLRGLSGLLQVQGVGDKEVQTRPAVQGVDYSLLPVSLRFSGTFRDTYRFLSEVETMRRLIRVDRLELRQGRNTDTLEVRVELGTFFSRGVEGRS